MPLLNYPPQKMDKNKPAAQAARQTLPLWSSTNRQNPPIGRNFWTTDGILMPFGIWKVLDHYDIVYLITWSAISNRLGMAAP